MDWDIICGLSLLLLAAIGIGFRFSCLRNMHYSEAYLEWTLTFSLSLVFSFMALVFTATRAMTNEPLPQSFLIFQVFPALAMILLILGGFVVRGHRADNYDSDENSLKKRTKAVANISQTLTCGTIAYGLFNTGYLIVLIHAYTPWL